MKTLETAIPGVVLLELQAFGDERGKFMETFRRDRYREVGIGVGLEFVQDNYSSSTKGVLRGLHQQVKHPQGKLVMVTRGEVWDVAVDVRRGSPTFGKHVGTVLSAENRRQLWVPPGFAHGFLTLSDHADFIYKCTDVYRPDDERPIRWDDPDLAIPWPLGGMTPIISGKDRAAALLRDAELPEYVR
jgi:dTDP-4-dehydrorhamnose 3,5-epimerase